MIPNFNLKAHDIMNRMEKVQEQNRIARKLAEKVRAKDPEEYDSSVKLLFNDALERGTDSDYYLWRSKKFARGLLMSSDLPYEASLVKVLALALRNEVEDEFKAKAENDMDLDEQVFNIYPSC